MSRNKWLVAFIDEGEVESIYGFDTKAERDAFLTGLDVGRGYCEDTSQAVLGEWWDDIDDPEFDGLSKMAKKTLGRLAENPSMLEPYSTYGRSRGCGE